MMRQNRTAPVFECRSRACANLTLPENANITEIRTRACAAFREALAAKFSLDLSTVTLTKCELTSSRRLLLDAEASAPAERALASQTFLCVRQTAATPWACSHLFSAVVIGVCARVHLAGGLGDCGGGGERRGPSSPRCSFHCRPGKLHPQQ